MASVPFTNTQTLLKVQSGEQELQITTVYKTVLKSVGNTTSQKQQ